MTVIGPISLALNIGLFTDKLKLKLKRPKIIINDNKRVYCEKITKAISNVDN